MKITQIFQNQAGTLFTLEDYDKVSGVCHANGITQHSEMLDLQRRAAHESGQLHYVFGIGDRKFLRDFKKRGTYGPFDVK